VNGSPENEKSDGNTDDKRKFPTDSLDLSFPSAFRSINRNLDIFPAWLVSGHLVSRTQCLMDTLKLPESQRHWLTLQSVSTEDFCTD